VSAPLNGKAAAALLAQRLGVADVAGADVRELANVGRIRVAVHGFPATSNLYDVDGFEDAEELRRIVAPRQAWRSASMDRWDAAEALGWSLAEFEAAVGRRGLRSGPFGRFCSTEVMALEGGTVRLDRRPAGTDPATTSTSRSSTRLPAVTRSGVVTKGGTDIARLRHVR
jgi:hypothetical protein